MDMDKLLSVVRIVNMGGYYVSASIIERAFYSTIKPLSDRFLNTKDYLKKENRLFSPTERHIINEIAQGFSDEEIAGHINYTAGSVRNCLTAIKRKTKLKNRTEIVVFSLVSGLVDFEQLCLRRKKNDGHIPNNAIQ
jgi:DNA-binding NarL/FixJ family response regulator